MPPVELVVSVHTCATLFMTGVIWFVQLVHYPLFAAVSPDVFTAYEARHTRRTVWVVAPPMVIELVTAVALVVTPPREVPAVIPWFGLLLVAVIWLSTSLLQIPCHRRLGEGFSATAHQRLVGSNWIRTITWSLRAVLALGIDRATS